MKRIVDIKLHPLSWHVLKSQFLYDGIAVDLGNGWLYNLVTQGLKRSPVTSPWEFKRAPIGMVEGRIYILEYDYNRYGCYMGVSKQANISMIIYRRERERLCNLTATAHIMAGVCRDTAMRYFLEKEGYEDDELSFAALRKYYQRHCGQYENDIMNDFNELTKKNKHKYRQ